MIQSQEQLQSILNTMKLNITFDFIPKFTRCIASYIVNCIDRVVRHQRDALTKRLQKRRKRLFDGCKYRSDKIKCKCDCNKCTKHRQVQRRNILEADFMTHFICNNPAKDEIVKASTDSTQTSCGDNDRARPWTLAQTRTQDHRDVQALDRKDGWEWWMKMQESAAYMPSLQHDAVALTKSVCSSASSRCYFKSCNTLTELNEELDQTQTDSLINDQIVEKPAERRRTVKHSQQPREVSKSDSKIESARDKTRRSSVFRSASTKTTYVRRSMNKRKNLALTKRRFKKRRPCKTRSYGTACHGPSARYFKNLSKRK